MTTHSDKAEGLIAEILEIVSDGDQFGERAKHPTTIKTRNVLEKAAAYIKELKAEVERLRALIGDHDLIEAGAYATMTARAAKAEEALRVIATNKTRLGITWAQEYAREDPGEGKA